ncbi:MAG: hypothetical protein Q8K65_01895 [Alphaproteobacteria bacterium]|nr:hypothetical protein [Alphaproteobacteria bacterium]
MSCTKNFLFISALLASFVLTAPKVAVANNDTEWKTAFAEWQKKDAQDKQQTDIESCQSLWDFTWLWAKRRNLEARGTLYTLMTMPKRMMLPVPSAANDYASLMRDLMIIQVHSAGVQYIDGADEEIKSTYSGMTNFYEKQINFWDSLNGGTYLSCIKEASTLESAQRCTQIAVEEKLVPSFEDYAAEIDTLIAQGLRPSCKDLPQKKNLR